MDNNITLESDIKEFIEELPFWGKYLAEKILDGNEISEEDIESSVSFLLEDLNLKPKTLRPQIVINYNIKNLDNYKSDLIFTKFKNVEGVNALVEKQTIEFGPNLTIVYGANGSGKSGYVRLLKKAFYSKAPEDILPNIHLEVGHKPLKAEFVFNSNKTDIILNYPTEENSAEFEQFAVFDGKSVFQHLTGKNELEFRPAGLSFFAIYAKAVEAVEQKITSVIEAKQTGYKISDFVELFDGESEIKTIIQNLSVQTKIDDLKKYTPFTTEDKAKKEEVDKKYDELFLILKGKQKEIQSLKNIKELLNNNRNEIKILNQYFTNGSLLDIKDAIVDYVKKEAVAKAEGIENFKTDKIEGIGTIEWKNFVVAARQFTEEYQKNDYPKNEDFCLFCHQQLSKDAQELIINYWAFIKSVAEENVRKAQKILNEKRQEFEKLNLDLFPDNNILTVWFENNHSNVLEKLKNNLSEQKILAKKIISDINLKTANNNTASEISFTYHDNIENAINDSIKKLEGDEQNKELEKLLGIKNTLAHKEKFNKHFSKFETYIDNQAWIAIANKADFAKRKITSIEKILSDKYFNQKYIEIFNEECSNLNGTFGIEINYTGSAGKSYRQLKLKGKTPNTILSEGEQKVIAISDFLSEIKLSEVNKGIIFDDPVTSLDHLRKTTIVERLIKESKDRQVIVFTHDIGFLREIELSSEKLGVNCKCCSIEKNGNDIGVTKERLPWNAQKVDARINVLKEELLSLKKIENGDQNEYLRSIKSWYGGLYETWEAAIEDKLFQGVIRRYSNEIQPKKIDDINIDKEIKEMVSNGMTEANNWRHDQGTISRILPDSLKLTQSLQVIIDVVKKTSSKRNTS